MIMMTELFTFIAIPYLWLNNYDGDGFDLINNSFADNLEEDSNYEVKVEARNEWGWSQTSEVFRFYTRNKGDDDFWLLQQWLNSGEDEDDKNVNSC